MMRTAALFGAAAAMHCPGSSATVHHAACQVTVTFKNECTAVQQEMHARINGDNGWVDPHNAGTYSVESTSFDGTLLTKRVTGNKKYTDKQVFTYTSQSGGCVMTACSESQVFSIGDFGTNFCNLHDLYCNTADGCKIAKVNLQYDEKVGACTDSKKSQCTPKAAVSLAVSDKMCSGPFEGVEKCDDCCSKKCSQEGVGNNFCDGSSPDLHI